jgi:DNA-directed RNA polymerase subunit E'/Rpb7
VCAFVRCQIAVVLVCLSLLATPLPVKAQKIVSNGQIAGAIVGLAAAGVVIGVGTYYLLRKASIKGCVVATQNDIELRNERDQQTYMLMGDTADIKAGDRVRVKGKKKRKDSSAGRTFLVEKLDRNYGPCKALPATP